MKYVKLGRTGLTVSKICLGCMSYGDPARGTHPWSLDEDASRPFYVRHGLESAMLSHFCADLVLHVAAPLAMA